MSEATEARISEILPSDAPTQALARIETGAVGRALSLEEVSERLRFVREVMAKEMKVGQDYGKVPGCGDKPGLFQPGAQKLLLTFQLREQVKREVLREFPNLKVFGHREYEITITVFPQGSSPENGWDGVGTCSTLESKYRYRKAERRCPNCGKNHIILGKAEYGGGWLCWKKPGGCGAKFEEDDIRITEQPGGEVENENPADQWNTVRKMAFKRALVAAAINATNTSELWTQDLEDMKGNAENAPGRAASQKPPSSPPAAPKATATPKPQGQVAPKTGNGGIKAPTAATRDWMLKQLRAEPGGEARDLVQDFFQKAGIILDTEALEDIPLRFVSASHSQLRELGLALARFEAGDEAKLPYPPNEETDLRPAEKRAPAKPEAQACLPTGATRAVSSTDAKPPTEHSNPPDPEWFMEVVCPIPHKGEKRDDYLKNPDTIGSLYEASHEQTADGEDARRRLFGFVHHFEPKGWAKRDGTQMPASEADKAFREALDAFATWHEQKHPEEVRPF